MQMAAVDVHSVAEINGVIKRDVMFTGSCTKAVMLQHNLVSHPLKKRKKRKTAKPLEFSSPHARKSTDLQNAIKVLFCFSFCFSHYRWWSSDGKHFDSSKLWQVLKSSLNCGTWKTETTRTKFWPFNLDSIGLHYHRHKQCFLFVVQVSMTAVVAYWIR